MRENRCPICDDPSAAEYAPFCSRRCADIDLGRWLRGVYRAPAEEEDEPTIEEVASAREAGQDE